MSQKTEVTVDTNSVINPDLNMSQLVYPEEERVDGILDLRQISIVNALPVWKSQKEVRVVGSGDCKLDNYLVNEGYTVYSTDMPDGPGHGDSGREKYSDNINYSNADIFDLESFPVKKCETVICSEVLEHIPDWPNALRNLLHLAKKRVIITVPHHRSYDVVEPPPAGHCNYWTDLGDDCYESLASKEDVTFGSILSFARILWPHRVSISKIVTKPEDFLHAARDYLIIIDLLQISDTQSSIGESYRLFWPEVYDNDCYRILRSSSIPRPTAGYPPTKVGPPLPYQIAGTVLVIHNFPQFPAGESPGRLYLNQIEKEMNLRHLRVQPVQNCLLADLEPSNLYNILHVQPAFKGRLKAVICLGGGLLTKEHLESFPGSIKKICCDFTSKNVEKLGEKRHLFDDVFDLSKTSWGEIAKRL